MKKNEVKIISKKAKKLLFKIGCAGALFSILNQEYDHPLETEEYASAPLCGGIIMQGYQCGMLWGAILAVGTEAFRRYNDQNKSIALAITTSKKIVESFLKRAKSVNCKSITSCSWTNIFGWIKYFITGKTLVCSNLIKKWSPEAIQITNKWLGNKQTNITEKVMSCASEVAKRMGATNEEIVMVSGFAGGIGLSGNGCGALSAAIWMKSLAWHRKNPKKINFLFPEGKKILKAFKDETNSEMLCHKICGRFFSNIDDHTKFIKNGGCEKLINILAQ